ncbi:MAG: hypothetical protein WBA10_03220, partial [Elainellaceae cyanobacterium]
MTAFPAPDSNPPESSLETSLIDTPPASGAAIGSVTSSGDDGMAISVVATAVDVPQPSGPFPHTSQPSTPVAQPPELLTPPASDALT